MKIIVGMSGGVDSSVAAYLLKKDGNEVHGVFYKLSRVNREDEKRCCDIVSAEYAARLLGIKVEIVDIHEEFEHDIVEGFLTSYKEGITPNPCTLCNEKIKFGLGFKKAKEIIGSSYFATGHYAIIEKNGTLHLKKGVDNDKDQSYMLWRLSKKQLFETFFPLGTYTKDEVKTIAKDLKIPYRRESQDICFINGKLRDFLREAFGESQGRIIDTHGNILGEHRGAYLYTVGQRSGIDISYKYPLYVININMADNTVTVGSREECFFGKVLLTDFNAIEEWNEAPISLKGKVRYKSVDSDCMLKKEGNDILVEFMQPQFAVTPGQSLVLYKGNYVFAGGIIKKAFREIEKEK